MYLADFIGLSGVEQYSFGHCGFTRVNMGNDTDITGFPNWKTARHKTLQRPGTNKWR
jgi:hypothetical protein